jgi:hypothetical protein
VTAVLLSMCLVASACGDRGADERFDGLTLSEQDRSHVVRNARQFGDLYFGSLTRATATASDLRTLRRVTDADLYDELQAKHRYAAERRRKSEYARDKLNSRTACRVGTVRVISRGPDRVLAEAAVRCGDRPEVGMVGWELVRNGGAWVVVDDRDARFIDGRCAAPSCES